MSAEPTAPQPLPRRCAVPGCGQPGVVTVSTSSVRVSFRVDHAQIPAWSGYLRCWLCAGAELDQLIASTAPLIPATDQPA
jgi:hypothetical protein